MKNRITISLIMIIIMAVPGVAFAYGSVYGEYLLGGENLEQPVFTLNDGIGTYRVYSIRNSNLYMVLDGNLKVPDEKTVRTVFFAYATSLYLSEHDNEMKQAYQNTYSAFEEHDTAFAEMLSQFLNEAEICKEIPPYDLFEVCVKPSDKLKVSNMPLVPGMFLDWHLAFENYKKLGGEIYSVSGGDSMPLERVKELFKSQIATENFLRLAFKATGDARLEPSGYLSTDYVKSGIAGRMTNFERSWQDRLTSLKEAEVGKKADLQARLAKLREEIRIIAGMNKDYGSSNEELKTLMRRADAVNAGDSIYTSDMEKLDAYGDETTKLATTISSFKAKAETEYNSDFVIIKWVNWFVGQKNLIFL